MAGKSTFTQAKADLICERLAVGESLRTVCRAEDMPEISTVFKWLRENEEFSKQYARAKEESVVALAEEIMDISDDGTNDWMEYHYGEDDSQSGWKINGEALQRSRLRVDTRKWLLSKILPKKYGDRIQQEITVPEGVTFNMNFGGKSA